MANFRSGYLEQGAPVGAARKDVLLSADGQVIDLDGVSAVYLQSDSTTATDRTFTLKAGGIFGHEVTFFFVSGSSYTCDLQSSGNAKLSSAWQPLQYDTLTVAWDGTYWTEVGRGMTGTGGVSAIADGTVVNADVSASAAIAFSKLATLTSGNIIVGSAGGVPTSVAMSGDVTIVAAGTTTIGANKVTVGMLAAPVMLEATGTISQAQMLALSTPVTLIAAPSAGQVHIVDEIELLHTYSTAAYATGSDVSIEYATSGDNIALIVDTFFTAGASANTIIKPSTYDLDGATGSASGFDVTANAAKAVQITASNFTNGNAANIFKYRIRYHTVTLLT
jgi:hypothetical protein